MSTTCSPASRFLTTLSVLSLLAASCSDSNSSNSSSGGANVAVDHSNIVLRDQLGTPLTSTSTVPYSPRKTCGACHDVDEIANGYHFQQGRTDHQGGIQVKDDFNADGRDWLKSDGMYGKW